MEYYFYQRTGPFCVQKCGRPSNQAFTPLLYPNCPFSGSQKPHRNPKEWSLLSFHQPSPHHRLPGPAQSPRPGPALPSPPTLAPYSLSPSAATRGHREHLHISPPGLPPAQTLPTAHKALHDLPPLPLHRLPLPPPHPAPAPRLSSLFL